MTLVSRPLTPSLSPKGEGKGVFLFSRGNWPGWRDFHLKEEGRRMLSSAKRAGRMFPFLKEAGRGCEIFPSPPRGEGQGEGAKGVNHGESLGI